MTAPFSTRAGLVAMAITFAVVSSACVGDESQSPPEAATVTQDASQNQTVAHDDVTGRVGPSRVEHGIPVGWSLDQSGAEAAAAAFVRSTSVIARSGPLTRRDAVLTMSTFRSGPDMVDLVSQDLAGLTVGAENRSVSPGKLLWVEYPLTVSSTLTSSTDARVQVWSVLVVGIEGGSIARQVWRTSTLTLTVEDGDWKVADWVDASGPSPVSLNDTDVASVEDLHEVASWTPAGSR